jgi:hypothetical protein
MVAIALRVTNRMSVQKISNNLGDQRNATNHQDSIGIYRILYITACRRMKLDFCLSPYTKSQLKMDPRPKCKTPNYEENIQRML